MLAEDGAVLEGLSSNFYGVLAGVLRTEQERVLPGVTRSLVIELAVGLLPMAPVPVRREELPELQEAFLTSVSRGIVPVVRIDDVVVGGGHPGPATQELMRRLAERVEQEAVASDGGAVLDASERHRQRIFERRERTAQQRRQRALVADFVAEQTVQLVGEHSPVAAGRSLALGVRHRDLADAQGCAPRDAVQELLVAHGRGAHEVVNRVERWERSGGRQDRGGGVRDGHGLHPVAAVAHAFDLALRDLAGEVHDQA
jgi:hypothetical protein